MEIRTLFALNLFVYSFFGFMFFYNLLCSLLRFGRRKFEFCFIAVGLLLILKYKHVLFGC